MRRATRESCSGTPAREAARQQVLAAVQAHLRGTEVAPLYLAAGRAGAATAILGAAAAEVRAAGRGKRLLVCTGCDFVALWRDTLRRGLTPFVRRALAATDALLLDGLEALGDDPVAQWDLARLIVPGRLVVLAGRDHWHRVAWSPAMRSRLVAATCLCLHDGPCVTDVGAWALIDRVAGYYGVTRAHLLARRRTADLALARQVVMYLLRQEGLTATHVGHLLRRDHSTVLHGDARIRRLGARPGAVRYDLAALHGPNAVDHVSNAVDHVSAATSVKGNH